MSGAGVVSCCKHVYWIIRMFLGTAAPALRSPLKGEKTDEGGRGEMAAGQCSDWPQAVTGQMQWTRREWEHSQSLGSRGERLARETHGKDKEKKAGSA